VTIFHQFWQQIINVITGVGLFLAKVQSLFLLKHTVADTMTCGANLVRSTSRQLAQIQTFSSVIKLDCSYCLLVGRVKHLLVSKENPLNDFSGQKTGTHLLS